MHRITPAKSTSMVLCKILDFCTNLAARAPSATSLAELVDPCGFFRAPTGPISWNCFGHSELNDWRRASRSAAMRLHTHRDESRSRHFDLTGGGSHPWAIDLVVVTVSALLARISHRV